tara:strand:- start:593 stop:1498 length:906 start_codon:yes stop_codon:yes gene_type:complete
MVLYTAASPRLTISSGGAATFTSTENYSSSGYRKYIVINSADQGGGGILWKKQSSAYNRAILANQGNFYITRSTADDNSAALLTDFTISSGGNVGIGTTGPGSKLELRTDTNSGGYGVYPALTIRNDNSSGYSAIHFNEGSTQKARLEVSNSTGTLGVYTGSSGVGFKMLPNGTIYRSDISATLSVREYTIDGTAAIGATVNLFYNTSNHTDIIMTEISVTSYHGGRTHFSGSGTVGGYGGFITGSGHGMSNGGLTSSAYNYGKRRLNWVNSSGATAQYYIYIRIVGRSGLTVENGSVSSS